MDKSRGFGFRIRSRITHVLSSAKKNNDIVIKNYHPKTWIDVGCGTGTSLKYVQKQKIEIIGLEFSALAIKVSKLGDKVLSHDLTLPVNLNRFFDVAWCYEVAEHLPEEASDTLIASLIRHSNCIVFSAATPGQGGEGHINEQPIEYWINKFTDNGFYIDEKVTSAIHSTNELYSNNVYCFLKHPDQG